MPRRWLSAAADLLLGASCPGCERAGYGLCSSCAAELATRPCHRTIPDPCPAGFPLTITASPYDELMQRLVAAHKEHQALALTAVLGERLALSVSALLAQAADPTRPVLLVPVPSTARAVRQRGLDATQAMARQAVRRVSQVSQIGVAMLLQPGRRLADQAGLDALARQQNLAGGLQVSQRRWDPRAQLVIVDDVVTTGTSLTEAARALAAAGAETIGAATTAATQRRRPR